MTIIVQKGDPVLRQISKEVPKEEICTPKLAKIIKNMKEALDGQDDGVAIAAPQIAVPLRIFIISGKVLSLNYPDLKEGEIIPPDMVFINPTITKLSREKKDMSEGCLSVRWLYGTTKRSTKATVRALDENGKSFTRGGSGTLAQAFQHEMDHLDGVLFVDNARNIEEVPPKPAQENVL